MQNSYENRDFSCVIGGEIFYIFNKCFFAHFISSYSSTNSNGKSDQYNRSFKENDTYAAPTSDRVERLGYTAGGGGGYGSSVNVNLTLFYSYQYIDLFVCEMKPKQCATVKRNLHLIDVTAID